MGVSDIQNYYNTLIGQKKQAKLDTLGQQETDVNNQSNQANQEYYKQGNQAVTQNTALRNRMQAWLTANNLGQSAGSMMNAMSNADNQLQNSLGEVNSNKNTYMNGIKDKLAQIQQQRLGINNGNDSDIMGLEADKIKAIADAQEAAASRAASASRTSSSATQKQQQQQAENALWSQFQDEFNKGNADDWLTQYGPQIMRDYSPTVYNSLVDQLNKYKTVFANNRKNAFEDQDANTSRGFYVSNGGRMLIE